MFLKSRFLMVLSVICTIPLLVTLNACGDSDSKDEDGSIGDGDTISDASVYEDGTTQDGESTDSSNGCLPDPDASEDVDSQVTEDANTLTDAVVDDDANLDGGTDGGGGKTDGGATDGGVDAEVDAGGQWADCPDDMVPVGPVCVDKYEASRTDATEFSQGTATGPAQSVAGVIPWHVNPMTSEALTEFETACADAGKRICEPSDWLSACEGPSGSTYVFGNTFDPLTCNCVDTFCADYCADNGIAPEDCVTSANCGYNYYCFHVTPTGAFPDCTSQLGNFDICGNVWEIVPSTTDPRGYEVRGGAYNCAGAAVRLQCTYNAGWTALFAGFRCCLDR